MNRRFFLHSLLAGGLVAKSLRLSALTHNRKSLKILVLGGTQFVGPAIVNAANQGKHQVVLFNRGISNPTLFPQLRWIKGDREKGKRAYNSLQKENWDIVIDVWPQQSSLVEEATQALLGHAKHYIFISSIAVYQDFQQVGLHEESEVVNLDLATSEWAYPEEKLAAERLVQERFPDRHTILRAGPIKGWRDPALDLLYWCIKLRQEDILIAPGSGMDPIQFVDVRDVGKFCVQAAEQGLSGIYNCVGPAEPLLWHTFLHQAKEHFHSKAKLLWAGEEFLQQHQVRSFSDLPLWAPLSEDRGFMQISNHKIRQTGFVFTPLHQTLDDCLSWYQKNMSTKSLADFAKEGIGLDPSKAARLIKLLQE
ncbi:MAG: NAD-dependent epimerase/dehydratase family protein [Bacteroidota bacterium]